MVSIHKSTVVPIHTNTGFFSRRPNTSTNPRSYSHTRVGVSVYGIYQQSHSGPNRHIYQIFFEKTQQIHESPVILTHTSGGISLWYLSTNPQWSQSTPIPDFFRDDPTHPRIHGHIHTHVWGYRCMVGIHESTVVPINTNTGFFLDATYT